MICKWTEIRSKLSFAIPVIARSETTKQSLFCIIHRLLQMIAEPRQMHNGHCRQSLSLLAPKFLQLSLPRDTICA